MSLLLCATTRPRLGNCQKEVAVKTCVPDGMPLTVCLQPIRPLHALEYSTEYPYSDVIRVVTGATGALESGASYRTVSVTEFPATVAESQCGATAAGAVQFTVPVPTSPVAATPVMRYEYGVPATKPPTLSVKK